MLAAIENSAEVAVLAMREGRLKQIHINDSRRDWNLDLVPRSATGSRLARTVSARPLNAESGWRPYSAGSIA